MAERRFRGFILFAEMRTGSNHLEESLNLASGLTCHGEVFNRRFVGRHDQTALFGLTREDRDADPMAMIDAMVAGTPGLAGFRFFHDHDPRILAQLLPDRDWAKVILRRDPLESYISLQIARATDQWRITDPADRRSAKARFDAAQFAEHADKVERFQAQIRNGLRLSGQAPFDLDYADILNTDVLNGLLAFLGLEDRLTAPSTRLKRQNPEPLHDKVENPEDMTEALAAMGLAGGPVGARPDLAPLFSAIRVDDEARRLYLPLPGVPETAFDGIAVADALPPDQLRPWLNRVKGHRVLSAVCHPVSRAWRLHQSLGNDTEFLEFLEAMAVPDANRPAALWPQCDLLAALASEVIPDRIRRARDDSPAGLDTIYDAKIEAAARVAYNRDYRAFGYGKWRRN